MADVRQVTNEEKSQPGSIKSASFQVVGGDMLKIRANAIDGDSVANERAVVCSVRFLNEQGAIIDQPYIGTSSSAVFGRYVYIASHSGGEEPAWIKEVIIAPKGASVLEVALFPWKTSEGIRIIDEIECLDIRRIPTDEFSWNVNAADSKEVTYGVLPFWRSLFSLELLRKEAVNSGGIRIKLQFLDCDDVEVKARDVKEDPKVNALVGTVGAANEVGELLISPVSTQCEYKGYVREMAVVQVIPPLAAVKVRVNIDNHADFYPARVSVRVHAFESLIDSRFTADSGYLITNSQKLPYDLADMSFTKLLEKRCEDISACRAALEFYLACGTVKKITATANHILNRLNDAELRTTARLALSEVKKTTATWLPSVVHNGYKGSLIGTVSSTPKVAHFLNSIVSDVSGESFGLDWKFVQDQRVVMGGEPLVITPLGYPEKGKNGAPWERHQQDEIACFYLNCLSVEQLELIPVTSGLNFMALLARSILMQESVDLIHVHESERNFDLAMVALALGRAMQLPVVYHKSGVFKSSVLALGEQKTLNQARELKDCQCMLDADVIIVSSQQELEVLAELGIANQKVFVVPVGRANSDSKDTSRYSANDFESCRDAYSYAQSVHLKKYQQ